MSYAPAVRRPWGMKPVIGLGVAGPEVDRRLGVKNPGMSWTGGTRAPWSVRLGSRCGNRCSRLYPEIASLWQLSAKLHFACRWKPPLSLVLLTLPFDAARCPDGLGSSASLRSGRIGRWFGHSAFPISRSVDYSSAKSWRAYVQCDLIATGITEGHDSS